LDWWFQLFTGLFVNLVTTNLPIFLPLQMDGLVVCFEQDEQFFGAGGNRRGTQEDDGLRESYFATRLSLLSRLAAARPPEYVAARAVLLRRSFSRRKPNREVLALALQQKQQARTASAPPPVVAAAAAPVKPKLFKAKKKKKKKKRRCVFSKTTGC
jgi:hypothetical protein